MPQPKWSWLLPRSPSHAAILAFCLAFPIGIVCWLLGVSGSGLYDGYMALADSVVHGVGYRFSADEPLVLHRPPLYPALLMPIAALPEAAWRPALVALNSLLVALAAAQTFALGRRWFGPAIGGWAALLFAADPWLLVTMHTTRSYFPELILYLFLSARFLDALLTPGEFSWRQGAWMGFLGGALTLTHASKLLTVGLLVGFLALAHLRRTPMRAVAFAAIAVGVMALVISPWTYRNWRVTGELIPIATNAGYGYFAGNAHWGVTHPIKGPDEGWPQAALRHSGVEADVRDVGRFWGLYSAELNSKIDRRMARHIREHPADFALKVACNAAEYYFPIAHPVITKLRGDSGKRWTDLAKDPRTLGSAAVSLYHAALWAAAIAGLTLGSAAGDRRAAWGLLVLIAAFALPYFPFLVQAGFLGYTVPTLPLLFLLAARCRAFRPI